MSESSYTRRLLNALNALPQCKAIKMPGGRMMETGTPDIIGSLQGRAFAIEVKMPGKKPTAIQRQRLIEWSEAGSYATVIETKERVAEVCRWLTRRLG